jgi:hypothetical protein
MRVFALVIATLALSLALGKEGSAEKHVSKARSVAKEKVISLPYCRVGWSPIHNDTMTSHQSGETLALADGD